MCNIYKNNLNIFLNLGENDIIYYDNNKLHIEDRYLCSFRGQKNPIKILDIFITSYNNYYNHYIISTEDKYNDSDNITELDVDISYFKNCIKGIRIYLNNISTYYNNINNISTYYNNINNNNFINKIDDLEKNTIENYLTEKENCKKLVDSISDKNNYGLFNYFFKNKNEIEGTVNTKEINKEIESLELPENNLSESSEDSNIEETDEVFEEQSSYYQEEKQSNYQYFEGIMYIIGRKISNLLLSLGNQISHMFFY